MIELPEAYVLASQINEVLKGKTIMNVTANDSPHAFAWFSGDPSEYHDKLSGKKITEANPGMKYTCGGNVEIVCEDMLLVISTPIKYHREGEKLPKKHQLLIEFEDFSHMSCTVQMWGGMFCYKTTENEIPEGWQISKNPHPLKEEFDRRYFDELLDGVNKKLSVKAFLATEQRIPGLGNGVLQDILFHAKIHPKTKLVQLTSKQLDMMYDSTVNTLHTMMMQGGRDTEKDLFSCPGGYKTILSKKRWKNPCPVCGDTIIREAYLGGNIYYCPKCQKYE